MLHLQVWPFHLGQNDLATKFLKGWLIMLKINGVVKRIALVEMSRRTEQNISYDCSGFLNHLLCSEKYFYTWQDFVLPPNLNKCANICDSMDIFFCKDKYMMNRVSLWFYLVFFYKPTFVAKLCEALWNFYSQNKKCFSSNLFHYFSIFLLVLNLISVLACRTAVHAVTQQIFNVLKKIV